MASFMKNRRTGSYDVIGLQAEVQVGDVVVTKRDGTKKTVYISEISKPFVGKYGENKGKDCVIGRVRQRAYQGGGGCHMDGDCASTCLGNPDCPCLTGDGWFRCY